MAQKKTLLERTEQHLMRLQTLARKRKRNEDGTFGDPVMDVADQLKVLAASTQFLAARGKLGPDTTEPSNSVLAELRHELEASTPKPRGRPKGNGEAHESG